MSTPDRPRGADAPTRLGRLRELGLTEYQAKAYLALLRLGKGTAAQVARVTDVPRNKLYPVMQQLNQMGIVETLLGEAQVFRPLPLDRYLDERLQGLRGEAEALEAGRGELADVFRPAQQGEEEQAPDGYRLFHGRAAMVEQVRGAIRVARGALWLQGTAGSAARMLASGEAEALRERLDEGVRARLVFPALPSNGEALERLEAALATPLEAVRGPLPDCLLLAVDGALALQAQLQPDHDSATRGNDVTLVSASPILAASVVQGIEAVARAAAPVGQARGAERGPQPPSVEAP